VYFNMKNTKNTKTIKTIISLILALIFAVYIPQPPGLAKAEDNRRQIMNVDDYPYSATAFIKATFPNGNTYSGSGAFVGSTTILTAAHMIHSNEDGGRAVSVTVKPGGELSRFPEVQGTEIITAYDWLEHNFDHDYAVIRIAEPAGVGWFGMQSLGDSLLLLSDINRYGFDGDPNGTLWSDSSRIINVLPRRLHHHAHSDMGSSGGPIVLQSEPHIIVGVHVAGSENYNLAVRITADVIAFVNNHRNACDSASCRWSEWTTMIEPGCITRGEQSRLCTDCGFTEVRAIPATGHRFGAWRVFTTPFCNRHGEQSRLCLDCGFSESVVIPPQHVHTPWTVDVAPHCSLNGLSSRRCRHCIHYQSAVIFCHCADCALIRRRLGDVTGGGTPGINDALEILKSLVGLPHNLGEPGSLSFNAALITSDDTPGINDATEILKFAAGLDSLLDPHHAEPIAE
jgi:V8-like Glu-specific endopeptidase